MVITAEMSYKMFEKRGYKKAAERGYKMFEKKFSKKISPVMNRKKTGNTLPRRTERGIVVSYRDC